MCTMFNIISTLSFFTNVSSNWFKKSKYFCIIKLLPLQTTWNYFHSKQHETIATQNNMKLLSLKATSRFHRAAKKYGIFHFATCNHARYGPAEIFRSCMYACALACALGNCWMCQTECSRDKTLIVARQSIRMF